MKSIDETFSNSDQITDQVSGLRSMATIAQNAAIVARKSLEQARNASLARGSEKKGSQEGSSVPPSYSNSDLEISRRNLAEAMISTTDRANRKETRNHVQEALSKGTKRVFRSNSQSAANSTATDISPEIESISVDLSKRKGSIDSFFSRITFSLGKNAIAVGSLRAVRIFRSENSIELPVPPLSFHGVDLVRADTLSSRTKNQEKTAAFEHRLRESSVENSLSELIPLDPRLGVRVTSGSFSTVAAVSPDTTFREIAFLSPDKLRGTITDDRMECFFDDCSIRYGRSYSYYIVSIDRGMRESPRSRIISINVLALRVPPMPKSVSAGIVNDAASFSIISEDMLVEKFEIWRKEVGPQPKQLLSKESRIVSGKDGFSFFRETKEILDNGSLLIGECVNSGPAGSTFYDRRVMKARRYLYRIFSVDVFGNKSERPREVELFVPEKTTNLENMPSLTLTAEFDPGGHGMRISIDCDSDSVRAFFLERLDLTIGQQIFAPPGQVNFTDFSIARTAKARNRGGGPHLNDTTKDVSWNGYIERTGKSQTFIDTQVSIDHVYQYRVYGIDKFGRKTSYSFSRSIMMTRYRVIYPPVGVTARVLGTNSEVKGVQLSWEQGNIDVSAEDRLGNRQTLQDTSVRTLYQVDRKRPEESFWQSFPMVEGSTFFDSINTGSIAPSFRPTFVEVGETYMYRVASVQSGGISSVFCDPVTIAVRGPLIAPSNLRVKSGDTRVKPLYAMLSWNTPDGSAIVDLWEIERAVVNALFADRINANNPGETNDLPWTTFRSVYRESSRSRAESLDGISSPLDSTIVGEHSFMDLNVTIGNAYFYRIRSMSITGEFSGWQYRGISMIDEVFERRVSKLSQRQREKVASSNDLIQKFLDVKAVPESAVKNYGIQPTFSSPVLNPEG